MERGQVPEDDEVTDKSASEDTTSDVLDFPLWPRSEFEQIILDTNPVDFGSALIEPDWDEHGG